MFSAVVTDYWAQALHGRVLLEEGRFRLTVNPDLAPERQVGVLSTDDFTKICLHPDVAQAAGLSEPASGTSAEDVLDRLRAAKVELNGADYLHYLPVAAAEAVRAEADDAGVRELTGADEALFTTFTSACSADDLDEAFVELDHWLVFGVVVEGVLVAAASAYVWDGSRLADVGVITHPERRGRGHARAVVRAISRRLLQLDYQPQYRCYHTNAASAAVALSAGMAQFGSWDMPPED
ncbi:GNAT family N-acetyltransferase [Ruania albidiflava]|uniref:GNAT family N-acetyltransferase n=1 Tax=Ruania albidiflava TaxID=366586 RepID=UPI0003B317FE|nr:GNAT family N-acetyltransferase [Ruania albidiflava]